MFISIFAITCSVLFIHLVYLYKVNLFDLRAKDIFFEIEEAEEQ